MKRIFVFGSNLAGIHGAGSALHARQAYGAQLKVGEGRTGDAYGIPTKDKFLRTLPLSYIQAAVSRFLVYAKEHPELEFEVVKIGCGLAGYKPGDIAPFFKGHTPNVLLPKSFSNLLPSAL
jgi:hypothetical protein